MASPVTKCRQCGLGCVRCVKAKASGFGGNCRDASVPHAAHWSSFEGSNLWVCVCQSDMALAELSPTSQRAAKRARTAALETRPLPPPEAATRLTRGAPAAARAAAEQQLQTLDPRLAGIQACAPPLPPLRRAAASQALAQAQAKGLAREPRAQERQETSGDSSGEVEERPGCLQCRWRAAGCAHCRGTQPGPSRRPELRRGGGGAPKARQPAKGPSARSGKAPAGAPRAAKTPLGAHLAPKDLEFEHATFDLCRLDKGQAAYVLSAQGLRNQAARTLHQDVCEACLRNRRRQEDQPDDSSGSDRSSEEGDEEATRHRSLMIECEFCSRGWHPLCLTPPMLTLPAPDVPFVCADCVRCGGAAGGVEGRVTRRALTASERFFRGDYYLGRIEKIILPRGTPLPLDPAAGAPKLERCRVVMRWYIRPEDTLQGRQAHQSRRQVFLHNLVDCIDAECVVKDIQPEVLLRDAFGSTLGDDVFLLTHRYNQSSAVYTPIRGSGGDSDAEAEQAAYETVERWAEGDSSDDGGESEREARHKLHRHSAKGSARPRAVLVQGLGGAAVEQSAPGGGGQQLDDNRAGVRFANPGLAYCVPPAPQPFHEEDDRAEAPAHAVRAYPLGLLDRARAKLTLSSVPTSMPCRHAERTQIASVVRDALVTGTCIGSSMYISGVPGTGKTATVKEVMREMRTEMLRKRLPEFFYVEVNGLRLPSPEHAFCCILEQLTGESTSPERALATLSARFASPAVKGRTTVLLLDELDTLQTPPLHNVLYNLFDWPTRLNAKLIVLGIANTMDLPERLPGRIISRMGPRRVKFKAYDREMLIAILTSRLRDADAGGDAVLDLFPKTKDTANAVYFIAAKVAGISGDARRALELLRRAAELAAARYESALAAASASGSEPPLLRVTGLTSGDAPDDAKTAIKEMFSSPHVLLIQRACLHERIFFAAMAYEARVTGVEVAKFEQLAERHASLCRANGIVAPSDRVLLDIACRLGEQDLLNYDGGRHGAEMQVQLAYSPADIWLALEDDKQLPWIKKLGNPQ